MLLGVQAAAAGGFIQVLPKTAWGRLGLAAQMWEERAFLASHAPQSAAMDGWSLLFAVSSFVVAMVGLLIHSTLGMLFLAILTVWCICEQDVQWQHVLALLKGWLLFQMEPVIFISIALCISRYANDVGWFSRKLSSGSGFWRCSDVLDRNGDIFVQSRIVSRLQFSVRFLELFTHPLAREVAAYWAW